MAPRFGNVFGGLHIAKATFANVTRFARAARCWLPRAPPRPGWHPDLGMYWAVCTWPRPLLRMLRVLLGQLGVGSLGPPLGRVEAQFWEYIGRSAHGQGHFCECYAFCSGSSVLVAWAPLGRVGTQIWECIRRSAHGQSYFFANVAHFVQAARCCWLPGAPSRPA